MTYTFESCFAARIEDFIAQKNALGFGYLESSRLLRDFDRFCMTHFPEENFLTEELCLAWATKKNTEGNNTFRNRMMPVREFARYLNRNGEAAYVLPPDIARKDAPYAPYIYTEDDILTIWDVFDHLKPRGGFPVLLPCLFPFCLGRCRFVPGIELPVQHGAELLLQALPDFFFIIVFAPQMIHGEVDEQIIGDLYTFHFPILFYPRRSQRLRRLL